MDVTTSRTTPTWAMSAHPLATPDRVNGGVLRMTSSWRSALCGTPNRCVSVTRPVGPSSMFRFRDSPGMGDLPPPRAQENVAEKARPGTLRPAEMGRSTDADGERECARASLPHSLHRPLAKLCFIDGPGGRTWGTDSLGAHSGVIALPTENSAPLMLLW